MAEYLCRHTNYAKWKSTVVEAMWLKYGLCNEHFAESQRSVVWIFMWSDQDDILPCYWGQPSVHLTSLLTKWFPGAQKTWSKLKCSYFLSASFFLCICFLAKRKAKCMYCQCQQLDLPLKASQAEPSWSLSSSWVRYREVLLASPEHWRVRAALTLLFLPQFHLLQQSECAVTVWVIAPEDWFLLSANLIKCARQSL